MQGQALCAWGLPRALSPAVYTQMTAFEWPPGPSAVWTGSETCRSNHVSLRMAEGMVWDLTTLWSCSPGREPGLKFRILKLEQGVGQPRDPKQKLPLPVLPDSRGKASESPLPVTFSGPVCIWVAWTDAAGSCQAGTTP